MHAAWYDRRGPAAETLVVGELPDPRPSLPGPPVGDADVPGVAPVRRAPTRGRTGGGRRARGRSLPVLPW
jgi:hypothetical protein